MTTPKLVADMTRGERVCAFIENFCRVPEGKLQGQPMRLMPWQRKFILEVYDNPHGTRLAILSVGRKNGKTPLIAALVLVHLAGPEAKTNSQIVSGAMSQKQASTVFKYAAKMVAANEKLQALVRVRPSLKQLVGLARNVEYSAISRQKKTAQGLAPAVAVLDELGQIRGPQDDFFDAIDTSLGAYDDAILFVISTQAASDTDLLSVLIDDYRENRDPRTVCHVYEATADCDVMDESEWLASNPALGVFRSELELRKQAENAARMPSQESGFRNLALNQRVETTNPLIPRGVWLANSMEPDERAFRLGDVYAGLDLSGRTALTALVLIAFFEGRWHVKPFFWTPAEGIHERSRHDRQPYALWVEKGLIRTTPGASIDYDDVAKDMREILADVNLKALGFDRWRIDVLKKSLERIGLELPLVEFGQGFKDMSPAVDALESVLLNDQVSHGDHPVLKMCAANVIASKDEAGNRKPNKIKSTGRIDGISGLLTALGIAHRDTERQPEFQAFTA